MAKPKKESVRKLEGYHVQKNGVDSKIIIGDERVIVIREVADEGAPRVFYWDWAEVAAKLSGNVSEPETVKTLPAKLETDPASQRSIPGTGAEPGKTIGKE